MGGASPDVALGRERTESEWVWAFLELWVRPAALSGTSTRGAFQFVSPYRGLGCFTERDAELFFGRDAEIAELLHILQDERVATVVGDSGSGKSSLLQAGLISTVRQHGLAGRENWTVYYLRPKDQSTASLYTVLAPDNQLEGPPTRKQLVDALLGIAGPVLIVFDQFEEVFTLGQGAEHEAQVNTLAEALAIVLESRPDSFRLVLGMRSEFLGQAAALPGLVRLIKRPWVLRPPSAENMRAIICEPATRCGYTFEGPLEATSQKPSVPALLQRILTDPLLCNSGNTTGEVRYSTSPLPLLQFALERLWLKSIEHGDATFRHADYDAIGGLTGAITQHADSVYESLGSRGDLGPNARRLAEQLFTGLVSHRGTRRPRLRGELLEETGNATEARPVLDLLVAERLLTVRSDDEDLSAATVDLSHESLLIHWDRLKRWLAEDPHGRALREEFRRDLERWEHGTPKAGRHSRKLLPGVDTAGDYVDWIDTNRPTLSSAESSFASELRLQIARSARLRRLILGGLIGLTVLAMVFGIMAVSAAGKAREAEHVAILESSSLRLEQAIELCEQSQLRRGLLAMVEGLQACPAKEKEMRYAYLTNLAAWLPSLTQMVNIKTLPAKLALATSEHGSVTLVTTADNDVMILKSDTGVQKGSRLEMKSKLDSIRGAISRDQKLAVVVHGKNYTIYDVETGKQCGGPVEHDAEITEVMFSPDNTRIVSVGRDAKVHVVEANNGKEVYPPLECDWPLFDLSFSNDSKLFVVGGGNPVLERHPKPGKITEKTAGKATGKTARKTIESSTNDAGTDFRGGAIVCELKSGKVRNRIQSVDVVRSVAINSHNDIVATGNYTLRFWDVAVEGQVKGLQQFYREAERTYWITFHPEDPEYLLVSTLLGTVRLVRIGVETQTSSPLPPQGTLAGIGFAHDGNTIFTVSTTGTYRTWKPQRHVIKTAQAGNIGTSQQVQQKPAQVPEQNNDHERNQIQNELTEQKSLLFTLHHGSYVMCTAYHPSGQLIATGTADGKIHLWKLESDKVQGMRGVNQHVLELPPAPGITANKTNSSIGTRQEVTRAVIAVRFLGADGRYLAATDVVGKVDLWDMTITPPTRLAIEKMNQQWEGLCTVSADGKAVVVHRKDDTLQVWDLVSNSPLGPSFAVTDGYGRKMGGFYDDQDSLHFDEVYLSADLQLLATINLEGKVYIWKVRTAEPIGQVLTHTARDSNAPEPIRQVCFAPTGLTLLTRSAGSVCLWDASNGTLISKVQLGLGVEWAGYTFDGRRLMLGTDSSLARVWDVASSKQVQKPFSHRARLWGIAYNPTSHMLLTAADDRTARFWDITAGKPLGPPLHHNRGVSAASFSPDGTRCITGSWDHLARVWAVPHPLPDDVPKLITTIEVLTGLHSLPGGKTALLSETEWHERHKKYLQFEYASDISGEKRSP
jgi:WD40 repeat protein